MCKRFENISKIEDTVAHGSEGLLDKQERNEKALEVLATVGMGRTTRD